MSVTWEGEFDALPGDPMVIRAELVAAPVDPNRPKIIGLN